MSGIIGCFTDRATAPGIASAMLTALGARGSVDHAAVQQTNGSFLGVSRFAWELGSDFSGPALLVEDGDLVIAADASLYYRDALRAALRDRGVIPGGDTPSHLILAAYRAWGEDAPRQLEGDFAFVIWNRVTGTAFLARDFAGRRSLFCAQVGGALIVGSTISAVLAHPACPRTLNHGAIGGHASGMLWSAGTDSCYAAIGVVPFAHSLTWQAGKLSAPARFWTPHVRGSERVIPFEAAAEELRALLQAAIRERLAASGPTSIWLSGGWDSTAVFGAGQAELRANASASGQQLLPVSISYPEGDPGREDDTIREVAGFWKSPIHWLDIRDIPLLDTIAQRAMGADEPPAHMYEPWNRALARGSRALGSHIAFDGGGGDQLFQVSDIYLSDLLRRGRLVELARELKIKRTRGLRHLFQSTVEPLLPASLAGPAARLSRSGGRHYMERVAPPWMQPAFLADYRLVDRDRAILPIGPAWSRADAETRTFLTAPFWSFAGSYLSTALLAESVETRSPLLDARIVEFALRRPVSDRASGRETKRLLRRAVRGTLPDAILAPRRYRTGLTVGYSRREMKTAFPPLFADLLASPMRLAELGMIDQAQLRERAAAYLDRGDESYRMPLYHTLNTELWLRGQMHSPRSEPKTVAQAVLATS